MECHISSHPSTRDPKLDPFMVYHYLYLALVGGYHDIPATVWERLSSYDQRGAGCRPYSSYSALKGSCNFKQDTRVMNANKTARADTSCRCVFKRVPL